MYSDIKSNIFNNHSECKDLANEIEDKYNEYTTKYDNDTIDDFCLEDFIDEDLIIDVWNNYLTKDRDNTLDEMYESQEAERERKIEGEHFHGSYWKVDKNVDLDDIDDDLFTNLHTGNSHLNCVYITDIEDDAEWFCHYKQDTDDINNPLVVDIMFQFEVDIEKVYNIEPMSTELTVDNQEYSVSGDREEYFEALSYKYNGVNIDGNYDNGGADIAIFDHDNVNKGITGIKLKINDEWTDFMSIDDAKETFVNYIKQQLSPDIDLSNIEKSITKLNKKDNEYNKNKFKL
jgi:hypothetical protein